MLPIKAMRWLIWLMGGKKPVQFAKEIDEPHSRVYQLLGRENERFQSCLRFLCKSRKASGRTWNQLGKELDEDYLNPPK